jgi:hypothetical protein
VLEKLDSVNWQRLRHAYGPAEDVPALIRSLDAPAAKTRAAATEKLAGALAHQGTLYSASPRAVPFIVELVNHGKHANRAQLLRLLVDLTFGSTYGGLSSHDVEARFEADDGKWAKASYEGMRKSLGELAGFLSDKDWEVRAALAYVLGWFPDDARMVAGALRDRLAQENDARVRASILFALGRADAALGERTDDARFTKAVEAGEPLERVAAAAALFYRFGDDIPRSAIDVLVDAARSAPSVPDFPWDDGDLSRLAGRLLSSLGSKHEDVAVDALLSTVERNPRSILGALRRVFPRGWKYGKRPLSPAQHKVIDAIVKDDNVYINVGEVRLALSRLGFPKSPVELAKVVGYERPPAPLDGLLDVKVGGGRQSLRVGDALMRAANGEAKLKGPVVSAIAKLPLEDQWRIVVEASCQDASEEALEALHALLIEIVADIRKQSEPAFDKKAADLAAGEPPEVLVDDEFVQALALYGYLAAAAFDSGASASASTNALYDDLAFRVLCDYAFPWLVRRVAHLPRPRRDAIIAKLKKEDETDSIDAIRAAR